LSNFIVVGRHGNGSHSDMSSPVLIEGEQ
jgi:hypothetical protein